MFKSIIIITCFLSWVPIAYSQEYNPLEDVYDMTLLTLVPLFVTSFQVLRKRLYRLEDSNDYDTTIKGYVDILIVFLLTGLVPNIPLFIRPLRYGWGFLLPIIISYTVFPMISVIYLMNAKFQLEKRRFEDSPIYANCALFLMGSFQVATSFTLISISWLKYGKFDNNILFFIPVIILSLALFIKVLIDTKIITFGWFFSVALNLVTTTLLYSTSFYEVKALFFTIIFCFIKLCDHLFLRQKFRPPSGSKLESSDASIY